METISFHYPHTIYIKLRAEKVRDVKWHNLKGNNRTAFMTDKWRGTQRYLLSLCMKKKKKKSHPPVICYLSLIAEDKG